MRIHFDKDDDWRGEETAEGWFPSERRGTMRNIFDDTVVRDSLRLARGPQDNQPPAVSLVLLPSSSMSKRVRLARRTRGNQLKAVHV